MAQNHSDLMASRSGRSNGLMLKTVLGAALVLAPHMACAETVNLQVIVLQPLTFVNISPLNFGNIIPGTTASVVRINENTGALTVTSGNATPAGGSPTRASFQAAADAGTRVKITIPNKTITLTRIGGTQTMQLNNLALDVNKNTTIPASGVLPFNIGGQLSVAAGQAAGSYKASFDITVDFR